MRRGILALVVLCAGLLLLASVREDVRGQATSPDGKLTATSHWRAGGAMSSGVTIVAVHPAGERVRWFHPGVFSTDGLYDVTLRWTRDALEVECRSCELDRIEVMRSEFRGYRVTYPRLATEALR